MYSSAVEEHRVLPWLNPYSIVAGMFLFLGFTHFYFRSQYDTTPFSLLILLGIIQVAPFVFCFCRRHFNYLAFVMIGHFFSFTFGRFHALKALGSKTEVTPETFTGLHQMLFCTLITYIIYVIAQTLLFYSSVEKEKFQMIPVKRWHLTLIAFYVLSFPVVFKILPAAWLALHFISVNADLVLLFCVVCPETPTYTAWAKGLALLAALVNFLMTGSLGMFVNFMMLSFLILCLRKQYRSLAYLGLLSIVVLFVQTFKGDYRHVLFLNPNLNLIERVGVFAELVGAQFTKGAERDDIPDIDYNEEDEDEDVALVNGTAPGQLSHGLERINDESLERVLAMTPGRVPFWEGESYASIPYMFIPRPLWPDKPSRHFWNKFGQLYGYLTPDDHSTSIAVSYLAEGYMNFGYSGLYGVAAAFGLLIAIAERLSFYVFSGYFYFPFIVFLMPLLNYASDFGSMLNPLVIFFCVMMAIRPTIMRFARKDEYS